MEETLEILDFICKECDYISSSIQNSKENDIKLFCISLLDRINLSSFSLKILLENFIKTQNKKFEYSAAIIIRSVMLDYLILIKAYKILNDESLTFGKRLQHLDIYCAQRLAESMIRTIEHNEKIYNQFSNEERRKYYPDGLAKWKQDFINLRSYFFEEVKMDNASKFQLREIYNVKIFKIEDIVTSTKTEFHEVLKVYEFYLYYSKYDHFGYISYIAQKEIDYNYRIEKFKKAICLFTQFYQYAIFILLQTDSNSIFWENQLYKIKSFISKLSCLQPQSK